MAFYISGPKLLFETTEISTHPNSTQHESNYIYLYTTKFGTSIKIRLNRKFESTEFETMRVNCMVVNCLDVCTYIYKYIYSEWCCSVSMVWVQIPSREEQKFDSSKKSNSNTVWFSFQTYIIFSINPVSLVTLRSSGTDILYGCHLLLDVCIIYFISCDCIMNSSLSYTIY